MKSWHRWLLTALFAVAAVMALPLRVFAAWEVEENNDLQTATSIAVNTSVTGYLSDQYDEDWYVFTTGADGMITVQFDHDKLASKDDYWIVYLYESDGETRIASWYVTGSENNLSPEIGLPKGTYSIRVFASDSSYNGYGDLNYQLKVNYTASSYWEKELNSYHGDETPIVTNQTYKGSIMRDEDTDWYKFTLTKSGMVTLQLDHKTLASKEDYWAIGLFQFDGNNWIYDGKVLGSENYLSPEIGLPEGTYLIRVMGVNISHRDYRYDPSTYSLKVNYTESSSWEKELNGSHEAMNEISTNQTYKGSIKDQGDEDWFTFTTDRAGYLQIQFNHEKLATKDDKWTIDLYQFDGEDSVNECETTWFFKGHEDFLSPKIGIPAGTYCLRIMGVDLGYYRSHDYDPSTYSFKVSFTGANDWESEPNQEYLQATALPLEKMVKGSMLKGESDWYKLTLRQDTLCTFVFAHDVIGDGESEWDVDLYEFDGSTQVGSTIELKDAAKIKGTKLGNLKAGTYYFRLRGSDVAQYSVAVKTGIYPIWKKVGGKWYYYDANTALATGWKKISGKTYYFNTDGSMKTGWASWGGKWYYLSPADGSMQIGLKTIGGEKYYFNADGSMKTGWLVIGKKRYYFNSDGIMQTGLKTIGGKKYFFMKSDGSALMGWVKVGKKRYYFSPADGSLQTGWLTIGGKKYYFLPSGEALMGWKAIGSKRYYFIPGDGALAVGWKTISNKKYYFDPNGAMHVGWLTFGSAKYYFNANGVMQTGVVTIGGQKHLFKSNGVFVK